jgi:hypothetical protein
MHELWALLHFIYPDVFTGSSQFDAAFEHISQTEDKKLLKLAPLLLKPFSNHILFIFFKDGQESFKTKIIKMSIFFVFYR